MDLQPVLVGATLGSLEHVYLQDTRMMQKLGEEERAREPD